MILKRGDRGDKVKTLQNALNRHGFNLDVDGIFGGDSDAAVRKFQKSKGLSVDGQAGKNTLTALGLDPDTLADLRGGDGDEQPEVITFKEGETDAPPVVKDKIHTLVQLTAEQQNKLLGSMLNALAQFETTMSFASAKEADPDIMGALVSKTFEIAVGRLVEEISSRVPGLEEGKFIFEAIKGLYEATTQELERAGKASQSFEVGNWIKDQRTAIDARMRGDTTKSNRDRIEADLESDYLEQDEQGQKKFFAQLQQTIEALSGVSGPSLDELEANLYTQWINAHFTEIGNDTPGCIEYKLKYDGSAFDFESCSVQAPFGDKIESALNRLLDHGQLPEIKRPVDFRVRKRVCLFVENFVPGGKSWSCGWLDWNNKLIHDPVHPPAQKGIRDVAWQRSTDRFKS